MSIISLNRFKPVPNWFPHNLCSRKYINFMITRQWKWVDFIRLYPSQWLIVLDIFVFFSSEFKHLNKSLHFSFNGWYGTKMHSTVTKLDTQIHKSQTADLAVKTIEDMDNSLRRVTQVCISKLTIIVSDNDLSPDRHQAIIWTDDGIF